MNLVTARIMSNVHTHGLQFAAQQEIKRFAAKGMGREAAITAGLLSLRAAIRHARAAK